MLHGQNKKTIDLTYNEAIELAWERGRLDYLLHDAQKLIDNAYYNSKSTLFVGNISRQFGKSFWAVTLACKTAIQKDKAVIKYATAFLSDLEEFIMPAFEKVLADCPEHLRPKFISKGSKWVFPNGSQIKLIGLDRKPNGLRGNTIDLIIIDECGFVSNLDYLYKSVILPAFTHRPDARLVLISTPPESPAHSFVNYISKAQVLGSYIHFTIFDNPLLSKERIDSIIAEYEGGVNNIEFRREYMAEVVVDENRALVPEWKDKYIGEADKTHELNRFWHRYTSMDIGVIHFTAHLYAHYNFLDTKLYIEDESELKRQEVLTKNIAEVVKRKEKENYGDLKPYQRISDNNNLILLQDLSAEYEMHFAPTNKDELRAMLSELRIMVNSGRIVVSPKCVKLLGCLKYGIWNKRKDKFDESEIYGHFDHLAALVYLVRNLDKHTNPVPPDFKLAISTHFIPEDLKQNKNLNEFKKVFNIKK